MTMVFSLLSWMIFFTGNSLCVDILKSNYSIWEQDLDSVTNLDASVSLWERQNCPKLYCALSCHRDSSCWSFFHHSSLGKCLASSSYKRGLPTDKAGQQGWTYYNRKQYCDEDYIFNQTLGLCYKLYSISETFDNAMITCEAEGAKLMTIRNDAEFRFIKEVMTRGSAASIFIGLRAVGVSRDWMWWNGQAASYFNWGLNQPDNAGGIEACVEIVMNIYNDIPCSVLRYFVCQRFV
ncbi:hypothetical protein ACJMK2_000470 [Sinanodonta woodiana]|uniref:C-type lectin domain-containing protein n=1 Tax=Sinanodonta woodiana TaxID=1069815 RepID=A0ABD3XPG1_SINWO